MSSSGEMRGRLAGWLLAKIERDWYDKFAGPA
jgi:hypothetical protein